MESTQRKHPSNPCEKASWLSKIFLTWTVPFFRIGSEPISKLDDIYEPLTCDKSKLLGDRLEANWNKTSPKRRTLLSVLWRTFWKDYAILAIGCFCNDIVLRLGQPFLLGYLLQYFRKDTDIAYHDAIWYAVGLLTLNGLNALFMSQISLLAFHNAMNIRVAVCSLIYRKALRLSQAALGETSPGKVVNLLSNDVNRFDWASFFLNSIWISPLLTGIVGCLLYNEVDIAGLIGILLIFSIVPVLSYAGKLTSKYRLQVALRTDERVRFMDEIISGVQVIKMYAWEIPFARLITYARKMELSVLRKQSYIRAIYITFMLFTTRVALFATMIVIILLQGPEEITSSKIFVISFYFNIISHMMTQRFPRSIAETAETVVALKRLEKFLHLEEKKSNEEPKNNNQNESKSISINSVSKCVQVQSKVPANPNISISMQNVYARWNGVSDSLWSQNDLGKKKSVDNKKVPSSNGLSLNPMQTQIATLNGLSIDFPKGKLIGVIGPVGAGKSSLLQALLSELPLKSGSIDIDGSISYASQEPWLFSASVRQNILFGKEYDRDRYNAVIETCSLLKDFEQFDKGDRTIVGERGASLSGGQKARLNLARACYRNADIYLLDDPLSAVDSHVGSHIFNKCIGPQSRLAKLKATRILVTHQIHFLAKADWLVVLKEGKVLAQGSPADLTKRGIDFLKLIEIDETPDAEENAVHFKRQFSQLSQISRTRSISIASIDSLTEFQNDADIDENDEGAPMEASSKGKVKGSVFMNYFRAGSNWFGFSILGVSFVLVQVLTSLADYFISVWTKQEETRTFQKHHKITNSTADSDTAPSYQYPSYTLSTEVCIYVQGFLVTALFVFGILRSIGFYEFCVRISQNIHNVMFNGIISTTMRFFDTNPSGRILNRFSRDIGAVDEFLPKSILDATQIILAMFGSIILAAAVNPYFLVPVAVLSIFFVAIQKIYLRTSKNLKRLEGITKSPVFTHLAATLSGLSTVRAYKAEEILKMEFDNHQDTHSGCWYMVISTNSIFGFSLDIICLIFTSCIIFYYMLFDKDVSGEKIGLAVTQALSLTGMVQWGVRQCAEVSNQMMSVERVLEYRDLEPEKQPLKPSNVTKDWPTKGLIEFRNVFYRYFAEAEPVLRDLSFVIKPREKIGIVGRTGAGKSSLIGAIFRLACVEGKILIDDIDTASIRLSDLRKRIAIIPQDPVLFSGTLRRNLDPFEEYSDTDIWSALESVELKQTVSDAFGLQSIVLPHGANYSVGQRQLLCLARAILRKNRILVLDEATANVDPQTDLLIQQTIREKFTDCTVLTVAHRLNTIIDSDRILVMNSGRAAEFDQPHCLLQMEDGIFHGMVKALGEQEYDRLSQAAHEQFKSSSKNQTETTSL